MPARPARPASPAIGIAICIAAAAATTATAAWIGDRQRGAVPPAAAQFEVRWHASHIVLAGELPDVATAARLRDAAASRTGDAGQVDDQTVVRPGAPPLPDTEGVAALVRLGADGWVLRWSPGGARLHGLAGSPAAVAQAGNTLRRAFAPDPVHNALTGRPACRAGPHVLSPNLHQPVTEAAETARVPTPFAPPRTP